MNEGETPANRIRKALDAFARDERGTTAIEYAVIATGISIAIVGFVTAIGSTLNTMYFGEVSSGLK